MHMIWTVQFVIAIVKPESPRAVMARTRFAEILMHDRLSFKIAFSPVRKRRIHTADKSWDRIVANAAPRTPICSAKIKIGSRIILAAAPRNTVIMPIRPKPWELINEFIPSPTITNTLPRR